MKDIFQADTISVIIDIVGEIFISRQIIATIAFNKHPINAIKDAVLKLVTLILFSY